MTRLITICVALMVSAMLTASFAVAKPTKPDKPESAKNLAAQACAAAKQADRAAFNALYGKHAMRECIKSQTKSSKGELKNASKVCKAERAADPVAFETTYGDPYSSNSFGKCVSTKVKADDESDVEVFQNAAKECKAERAADPVGFKATYGTLKSKGRNAFGKCVSTKVKQPVEATPVA